MKKLFITLFAFTMSLMAMAQATLSGRIVDEATGRPIVGATITLGNQSISTQTNENGDFTFYMLETGDDEMIIEATGYISDIQLVSITNQSTNLDAMELKRDIYTEAQEEVLLNLAETEINDDEGRSQEQSSASSASIDVFNNITSFAWSTARYRNRGYDQRYETNYINGMSFNSAERGTFNFSAMGGLNDASRNKEVVNSIEANNFSFGGIGNATNYLMEASRFAQGWKIGVAGTNRNYKAAVRATYASGVLTNGWSFVGQVAFRFGPHTTQKGIIGEGIDYYSGGYFFGAEKLWQSGSKLNIVAFGSPTKRGQNSALTQEVIDLTGSSNYNPYWGYQNGKIRNSREVKSFDPTALVTYEHVFNESHKLRAGVAFHYSMYSNSALNFYNAPDPRPDYYRNLPSFLWDGQLGYLGSNQMIDGKTEDYYPWGLFVGEDMNGKGMGSGSMGHDGNIIGPSIDAKTYNALVDAWKSRDNATTQLNWDAIYAANIANNHNLGDAAVARYFQERRHNDIAEEMANISYIYTGTKHLKLTVGLEGKSSQGIHYKTMEDLLGANRWVDLDPFADRDIKELATNIGMTQAEMELVKQNNMFHPNSVVKDGDRFGYDYHINMLNAKAWIQNEWSWSNFDLYYALQLTYSSFGRTSNMLNGRAWYLAKMNPNQANLYLGKEYQQIMQNGMQMSNTNIRTMHGYTHQFVDPALKVGFRYKIDGRNHIKLNAIAQTAAPLARDAYISSRVHDRVTEEIYKHDNAKSLKDYYAASEKSVGGDLTYEFNYPLVRGRVTGFYTQFWGGSELNGYYDDEANTFVNQTITGINRRHYGVEAAAAFKLGTYFTLTPALSVGSYKYTNNAYSVTTAENGMSLSEDAAGTQHFELRDSVLLKGLHIASGPQVNTSLKLSFFHPKMWFADITVSYYDWNYLNVAPARRMKGLYTGTRADGTSVDGWYGDTKYANYGYDTPIRTVDGKKPVQNIDGIYPSNAELDANGVPVLNYPYNIMSMQESLVATNPLNRFIVDMSVGKLIYLKNQQSLSINLSVTNLTNNTHFKTGGYQQARLPKGTIQGADDYKNNLITPNAWKYPSKYYYAWGANFYLSMTYKF